MVRLSENMRVLKLEVDRLQGQISELLRSWDKNWIIWVNLSQRPGRPWRSC